MLATGEPAPDFELPDQDGNPVRLSEFDGTVVLYFYPKANTRGCSLEARGFREEFEAFEAAGITVLGISVDPVEEIAAFSAEEDLPFRLLSDPDGEVATAYDTFGTTEVDGQTYEIAFRNTYIVKNGEIVATYEEVSPEGHAAEVLADLA